MATPARAKALQGMGGGERRRGKPTKDRGEGIDARWSTSTGGQTHNEGRYAGHYFTSFTTFTRALTQVSRLCIKLPNGRNRTVIFTVERSAFHT